MEKPEQTFGPTQEKVSGGHGSRCLLVGPPGAVSLFSVFAAINHTWLLSGCNVASAVEFPFIYLLIHFFGLGGLLSSLPLWRMQVTRPSICVSPPVLGWSSVCLSWASAIWLVLNKCSGTGWVSEGSGWVVSPGLLISSIWFWPWHVRLGLCSICPSGKWVRALEYQESRVPHPSHLYPLLVQILGSHSPWWPHKGIHPICRGVPLVVAQMVKNLPAVQKTQVPCGAVLACSVVSDSLQPHGLQPTRLLCPWDFLGRSTGVGCHFLLKEVFQMQGLKGLLNWQADSLPMSHLGSPYISLISIKNLSQSNIDIAKLLESKPI